MGCRVVDSLADQGAIAGLPLRSWTPLAVASRVPPNLTQNRALGLAQIWDSVILLREKYTTNNITV